MKKLLLILLCLPVIGFGQTGYEIIKGGFEALATQKHLQQDEEFRNMYPDHPVLILQSIRNSHEQELADVYFKKLEIGYKYIYLLNGIPDVEKKYFELYWKTAIESFPFINDFNFREKVGHSYRNELDYSYAAIRHSVDFQVPEVYSANWISDTFSKVAKRERFERNFFEEILEMFAKYTPFLLFIIVMFILFNKIEILKRFVCFGFVDDKTLRKRLLRFLIIIFLLPHIFILLGFLNNYDILYISIFENFSFGYTPNNRLYNLSNNIECFLYVEWNRVLVGNIIVFITSYLITVILHFNRLKNSIRNKKQ